MTIHEVRVYSFCVAVVLMSAWNLVRRKGDRRERMLGATAIMIGIGLVLPWGIQRLAF